MLVSRILFILFAIVSLIFIVFFPLHFYSFVASETEVNYRVLNFAEKMVFYSLMLELFLLLLLAFIFISSVYVNRIISKMSFYFSRKGEIPEVLFRNSSRFGIKLKEFYEHINSMNQKKTLKIVSMNNLLVFLCDYIEDAVLVSDSSGRIVHVSKKFLELEKCSRPDVVDKMVAEFFPELEFATVLRQINVTRSFYAAVAEACLIYPVFSDEGNIAYCIFELQNAKSLKRTMVEHSEPQLFKKEDKGIFSIFKNIVKGKKL